MVSLSKKTSKSQHMILLLTLTKELKRRKTEPKWLLNIWNSALKSSWWFWLQFYCLSLLWSCWNLDIFIDSLVKEGRGILWEDVWISGYNLFRHWAKCSLKCIAANIFSSFTLCSVTEFEAIDCSFYWPTFGLLIKEFKDGTIHNIIFKFVPP